MHIINDISILEKYLRSDPALHAYGLGDLDEFFRPYTTWYGDDPHDPQALILRYEPGNASSVFHLLCRPEYAGLHLQLFTELQHTLPEKFETHVSPAITEAAAATNALFNGLEIEPHEKHFKMEMGPSSESQPDSRSLQSSAATEETATAIEIVRATDQDCPAIIEFFTNAYPENWFDPRMLATGVYFIARARENMAAVAGVHVYSEKYKVAALGNIATHSDFRRQGIARRITDRLCQELRRAGIATITLNVKSFNTAAIACSESIGFQIHAEYEELSLSRQRGSE